MCEVKAGKNGEVYVPYSERSGNKSIVYFTRDLSSNGLKKIYDRINSNLNGKIAIKLHTGEKHGPNIIPSAWVKELVTEKIDGGTIIETNTLYDGDRYTTEKHLDTLKVNGWDFCPVDIIDSTGTTDLKVEGGKWFDHMTMGKNILNYDSLLVLTHFKGHTQGGFGGSAKNIGIGCADGRIGKAMIHGRDGKIWGCTQEEFMEKMMESAKAVVDNFKPAISFINVMRNMSVSCDCEGLNAEPVVTPNVGILASVDMLAVDQACVDLVYAMKEEEHHALVERIESRHGLRQLSYMKEIGIGNDLYDLVDIDNGDVLIEAKEAVKDLKPFEK